MRFRHIRVSILTGAEAAEDEVARIVVRSHPDLNEPKQFDALPIEVKDLKPASNLVAVRSATGRRPRWSSPGPSSTSSRRTSPP